MFSVSICMCQRVQFPLVCFLLLLYCLGSSYVKSLETPCMEPVSCSSLPCNLLLLSQSPVDVVVGSWVRKTFYNNIINNFFSLW